MIRARMGVESLARKSRLGSRRVSRCAWAYRCESDGPRSVHSALNTGPCVLDWIRYIVCAQFPLHIFAAQFELYSSSPGIVVANTQSVGASLAVWVAAGVLAWTGASSFAELGASIPVNGGAQAYLAYAYGPLMSYLFTWTSVALKPGANAVIALIFGMRAFTAVSLMHAEVGPQRNIRTVCCSIPLPPMRLRIVSPSGPFKSPPSFP